MSVLLKPRKMHHIMVLSPILLKGISVCIVALLQTSMQHFLLIIKIQACNQTLFKKALLNVLLDPVNIFWDGSVDTWKSWLGTPSSKAYNAAQLLLASQRSSTITLAGISSALQWQSGLLLAYPAVMKLAITYHQKDWVI